MVTNIKEARKMAERFIRYVKETLLTDIKVNFYSFDACEVGPSSLPDLFSQRSFIFFGKYRNPYGKIVVKGKKSF